MTYSSGGLIQAADFNGFAGPTASGGTAGANLNDIWATGSGDKGWGQTAVANPSVAGTVTATQWASLVNNLATAGTQTSTTLTSRTAPTAGQTIGILSALNTDLTSVTTNRGNAAASGTQYGTYSGVTARTGGTGGGTTAWSLNWTQYMQWTTDNACRYFWNAGGLVRLQFAKSSTGTDIDPDWNLFAGLCGSIYFSGRVNGAAQTIAGQSYTGTTRIGGTGGTQTTLATTTGYYSLTSGVATTIFQLNNATSPYTGEYIQVQARIDSGNQISFLTTWYQPAVSGAGQTNNISGGTDTASPATSITGTAPTTLLTYLPPSSTLTNSWGTPTITTNVVAA